MTTVLFIHGTGVREPAFAATYAQIKAGLHGLRPDLRVERCYWGEIGARLQAGGKSFYFDAAVTARPARASTADEPVPEEEKELARWARLRVDPLFEIRLYELGKPQAGDLFGMPVRDRVLALPGNPRVAAELASGGLTEAFGDAVRWVAGSPEFAVAFDRSTVADGFTERMLSRALVARCLATAADDGTEFTGDRRDRLVSVVQAGFGVPDYGVGDKLGDLAKNLAFRCAGPPLRRRRRTVIDQLADIVLYQAHGDAIREFVRDRIRQLPGPVVLLAHSLGGIVAFDLLAGNRARGLGHVAMLVTVGSQVPLLYELGALTCGINYGVPLPSGFPPSWVNVYDEQDLLGYAGAELFGDRCRDLPVDTRQPFPMAHHAYWDDTGPLYQGLADALQGEGL
ncbi:MAG TPA: hypothetical protein VKU77_05015 [Streptosporangiaceae bacterium]|nr:hypothetical protein [Streptosporangiaceae bacterium]